MKNIKWEEINESEFKFHLASQVQQKILIRVEAQEKLLAQLKDDVKIHPEDYVLTDALLESATLSDFFYNDRFVKSRFDSEGNIIGLDQGGDDWVIWYLIKAPQYVEDDSFFVLKTDLGIHLKLEFNSGKVRFFREAEEAKRGRSE